MKSTLQMAKPRSRNLVLLPGLDGTGHLFAPFLACLPASVKPIVVEYPVDQTVNYQQLVPEIRELAPWDEPYLIVAESFGGPLALYFTAAQWEYVDGVVLVSSFITNPLPSFMNWVYSMMGETLFKTVPPTTVLKKYLLGKNFPPTLEESVTNALMAVKPDVLTQRIKLVVESNSTQALKDCSKPILYLHGSQDELLGDRGWKEISAAKPSVAGLEIDGPHMLLQTRPREAWAAIDRFWQQGALQAQAA